MSWDHEVDVLVIGSGGSGMMAAIKAADLGAQVLLTEKSEKFGGTTALSGGCLWVPANHLQDHDTNDSAQLGKLYLKSLTNGSVSEKVIDTYIEKSDLMLRFLDKESNLSLVPCNKYCDYYPEKSGGLNGARTVEAEPFDGQTLGKDRLLLRDPQKLTLMFGQISLTAREAHTLITGGSKGRLLALKKVFGYFLGWLLFRRYGRDRRLTLGQGLVAGMWQAMKKKGVETRLQTTTEELIIEEGRVAGVVLKDQQGSLIRVKTKNGVVIASGGFAHNSNMKEKYIHPELQTDWSAAVKEDTGDAFHFCSSLKPAQKLMDQAWWMPVMRIPGEDFARSIVVDRSLPGCIVVDNKGQRFTNESSPYEDFVKDMQKNNHAKPCWLITDHFHRKNYTLGPLLPGSYFPQFMWPKSFKKNWIKIAKNISELAKATGIDEQNLIATVATFNQQAKAGKDPIFHRGTSKYDQYYADKSAGINPCLRPLNQGPFYAVKLYPGDLGTKGGFVVNEKAQVLNNNGEILHGLYAAGNATANPLGNIYPGAGGTLGPGLTFGYIAAETMMNSERDSIGKHSH